MNGTEQQKQVCVNHKVVVYANGTRGKRQKLVYRCEKCGHEPKK